MPEEKLQKSPEACPNHSS